MIFWGHCDTLFQEYLKNSIHLKFFEKLSLLSLLINLMHPRWTQVFIPYKINLTVHRMHFIQNDKKESICFWRVITGISWPTFKWQPKVLKVQATGAFIQSVSQCKANWNNKNRFIQLHSSQWIIWSIKQNKLLLLPQVMCILVINHLTHLLPNKLHFAIFTHCIGERTNLFMNLHKKTNVSDTNVRQCYW